MSDEDAAKEARQKNLLTDLERREVRIGKTTFYFEKMTCEEAFQMFETIRPQLGGLVLQNIRALGFADTLEGAIAGMVASIPKETIDYSRATLYGHVYFTNESQRSRLLVREDVNAAFVGLTMFRQYEVIIRAFVVNFIDSWHDMMSLVPSETSLDTVLSST